MRSHHLDRMRVLIEFGPEFLTPDEQVRRVEQQLSAYFEVLAKEFFKVRGREFWNLHKRGLGELGYSIYNPRFGKAIVGEFVELASSPKTTRDKIVRHVKGGGRGVQTG